jgi:DUF4097 and DUF4098 domain-containing protein YvlB
MNYNGNLSITPENAGEYADLESVGGHLYIETKNYSAPSLKSVSGDIYVHARRFSAPALTTVSGDIYVEANGFTAPALKFVRGDIYFSPLVRARNVSARSTRKPGY